MFVCHLSVQVSHLLLNLFNLAKLLNYFLKISNDAFPWFSRLAMILVLIFFFRYEEQCRQTYKSVPRQTFETVCRTEYSEECETPSYDAGVERMINAVYN